MVGSPHFFLSAGGFFCPTLAIARVDGQLRITTNEDSLASFLDVALHP